MGSQYVLNQWLGEELGRSKKGNVIKSEPHKVGRTYFRQLWEILARYSSKDRGSPYETHFAEIHFLLKSDVTRGAKKSVQFIFMCEINMKQ